MSFIKSKQMNALKVSSISKISGKTMFDSRAAAAQTVLAALFIAFLGNR
ncbi:MAG: hypothetical protein SOY45_10590 [Lachnospiraceae bacterium]|nr:hypothetical protein [Lachnospiraceae bacterium]